MPIFGQEFLIWGELHSKKLVFSFGNEQQMAKKFRWQHEVF
jgi:hypothetical protein